MRINNISDDAKENYSVHKLIQQQIHVCVGVAWGVVLRHTEVTGYWSWLLASYTTALVSMF